MFLVDTNVIIEILLRQKNAKDAKAFLNHKDQKNYYITEFALYSVGIILFRRNKANTYLQIVNDLFVSGGMRLVSIEAQEMQRVVQASRKFNLDFDDAYQYAVAEKYDLTIVSFDHDFDRTKRGRKTPAEVIAK